MTVSECCLIKLLPYTSCEKYRSALEMANPGNQHSASCIGALSFPVPPCPWLTACLQRSTMGRLDLSWSWLSHFFHRWPGGWLSRPADSRWWAVTTPCTARRSTELQLLHAQSVILNSLSLSQLSLWWSPSANGTWVRLVNWQLKSQPTLGMFALFGQTGPAISGSCRFVKEKFTCG